MVVQWSLALPSQLEDCHCNPSATGRFVSMESWYWHTYHERRFILPSPHFSSNPQERNPIQWLVLVIKITGATDKCLHLS